MEGKCSHGNIFWEEIDRLPRHRQAIYEGVFVDFTLTRNIL